MSSNRLLPACCANAGRLVAESGETEQTERTLQSACPCWRSCFFLFTQATSMPGAESPTWYREMRTISRRSTWTGFGTTVRRIARDRHSKQTSPQQAEGPAVSAISRPALLLPARHALPFDDALRLILESAPAMGTETQSRSRRGCGACPRRGADRSQPAANFRLQRDGRLRGSESKPPGRRTLGTAGVAVRVARAQSRASVLLRRAAHVPNLFTGAPDPRRRRHRR